MSQTWPWTEERGPRRRATAAREGHMALPLSRRANPDGVAGTDMHGGAETGAFFFCRMATPSHDRDAGYLTKHQTSSPATGTASPSSIGHDPEVARPNRQRRKDVD
jgi:hypothetical protein